VIPFAVTRPLAFRVWLLVLRRGIWLASSRPPVSVNPLVEAVVLSKEVAGVVRL